MKNLLSILLLFGLGAAAFYYRTGKKLQGLKIDLDKIAKVSISKGVLLVKFGLKIANPNEKEGVTLQEINLTVSDGKGNTAKIVQRDINQTIPARSVKPFNVSVKLGLAEAMNIVTNFLDMFTEGTGFKDVIPKDLDISGYVIADNLKFPVNQTIQTS